MAVKPGSLFPKHLLYLLAPSFQAVAKRQGTGWRRRLAQVLEEVQVAGLRGCSFFEAGSRSNSKHRRSRAHEASGEDLALMSSHSGKAAQDGAALLTSLNTWLVRTLPIALPCFRPL